MYLQCGSVHVHMCINDMCMYVYMCILNSLALYVMYTLVPAGSYEVPISCLIPPSGGRCLREPDQVFIESLKKEMVANPTSIVSPIVGVVQLRRDEIFDSRHPQGYIYETIGGNNSRIALQELVKEHPNMDCFKTRLVAVYVGLSDEEALRVASKHNRATSFTHSMTTQDKVHVIVLCYMYVHILLCILKCVYLKVWVWSQM